MEKVEVTQVYWKFHVSTLAKKLFERKILVHIKEYSLLVEKLHDILRVFPDTNLSFYLVMNALEYPGFAAKIWRDWYYCFLHTLVTGYSSRIHFGVPYCQVWKQELHLKH